MNKIDIIQIASGGGTTYVDSGDAKGSYKKIPAGEVPISYCRHLNKFGFLSEPASTNVIFPSNGVEIPFPEENYDIEEVGCFIQDQKSIKVTKKTEVFLIEVVRSLNLDKPFCGSWYIEEVTTNTIVTVGFTAITEPKGMVYLHLNLTSGAKTEAIANGTEAFSKVTKISDAGPNGGRLWKIEVTVLKTPENLTQNYLHLRFRIQTGVGQQAIYHFRQVEQQWSSTSPIVTTTQATTRPQNLIRLERDYLKTKEFTLKAEFSRNGLNNGSDTVDGAVGLQQVPGHTFRAFIGSLTSSALPESWINYLRIRTGIYGGSLPSIQRETPQVVDSSSVKLCRAAISQEQEQQDQEMPWTRNVAMSDSVGLVSRKVEPGLEDSEKAPLMDFKVFTVGHAISISRTLNGHIFNIEYKSKGEPLGKLEDWVGMIVEPNQN